MPEARTDLVAKQTELVYFTRYPLPNKIIADKGKERLAEFKTMMTNDDGIPCNSIRTRNL